MKKNPGRKERRRAYFQRKRARGKEKAKLNEFRQTHPWMLNKKPGKDTEKRLCERAKKEKRWTQGRMKNE